MRHNTAAVKLIYQNALDEELSEAFLKKAIEHNRMLAKLSSGLFSLLTL